VPSGAARPAEHYTWAGWLGLIVLVLGAAAGVTVPLVFHLSHWLTAVILAAVVVAVVLDCDRCDV